MAFTPLSAGIVQATFDKTVEIKVALVFRVVGRVVIRLAGREAKTWARRVSTWMVFLWVERVVKRQNRGLKKFFFQRSRSLE